MTEYEIDPEGMSVPYPPLLDDIRRNNGFEDVRGNPERAAAIVEAAGSSALKALLVALAAPGSPLFTLGCDLGTSRAIDAEGSPLHLAGGYVQVISARYSDRRPDEYHRFAKTIAGAMQGKMKRHAWRLRFVLCPARVNLDGNTEVEPSLWLWFDAAAPKAKLAAQSREDLLNALLSVWLDPAVLTTLDAPEASGHAK